MTFSMLVALALIVGATVNGQSGLEESIECPFPGGPSEANEANCALYSACEWSGTQCHMKSNLEIGYSVTSAPEDTGRGFRVSLAKSSYDTMFNGDIQDLTFEVIYHEDFHVQIKITDSNNARYEPPVALNLPDSAGTSPAYEVIVSDVGEPFSFSVVRSSNGNYVFNSLGPLTYEDQFIQLTTTLASSYLYGFGESTHTSLRHVFDPRTTYAIFSRDQPVGDSDMNEYGHHPYYMLVEDDEGNTHSVLFFNSNAMEYSTFLLSDGNPALTLRTIGGIVDLHFFLGSSPEDVNVKYINMIGKPAFPPYYALGFHLSRWGYASTQEVRELRERMKTNNIPQDVQTFDIDYMDRYRDFTVDPVNWADFSELISELHADNIKVTVILDPGLVIDFDNYPPGERGRQADVFIKWGDPSLVPSDQPESCADYVVGYCWPTNKTVYPDFLKPETQQWWSDEIVRLHETVDFDLIWVDMNEPANFGTDTDRPFNYPEELPDWSLKCPYNNLDSPPYPTKTTYTGSTESHRISDHTLCMSSVQTDGVTTYRHYDVHSLYGVSQMEPTYRAMEELFPGKRHMILSRSTFPTSGKYAVHWLGDNTADWTQMRMSIIGMIEFNMFGMPFVGADVCGFFQEPSEEMCTRWMELGAFYPFNRNHNAEGNAPQDPGMWPSVAEASRNVLELRYKYNPYLYALFHRAHDEGRTVVRPLFNEFPTDLTARDIADQFLWGSGLMVAPVLDEGIVERNVYFPQSNWYDIKTGELISSGSEELLVLVPVHEIPVYVRGGNILPHQEPAMTTAESRLNPFGATVAIQEGSATGEIYWDDGESEHNHDAEYFASMTYSDNTFNLTVEKFSTVVESLNMTNVAFYGYDAVPSGVTTNGEEVAWEYDADLNVLAVFFDVSLDADITISISN